MQVDALKDHGLELNRPTEGYVRSPGLHLSEIYNSLYKELQPERFDKKTKEGDRVGPDPLAMEFGTSFEEDLEEAIARRSVERAFGSRPGEFACLPNAKIVPVGTPGSIIFSPDQFLYNGVVRLGEFKSTRMTIGKGIREAKFDKWFCQIMGYGKPLKMPDARLYSLFINGHGKWKPHEVPGFGLLPSGPLLLAWDLHFRQVELDDNWDMLMRHARKKGMI